ncbi:retron Ec67 family RNA-directed DNA polymerase/endonuclease [Pseudomonas sp. NPDC087639]|uniref:retron Ec67 family RNA-directed DNA polymerase/endonuclease n=1 Tax=Pseudomonas sp. NPDC087639 TaxID=3364445 RepID=UPI0037F4049A
MIKLKLLQSASSLRDLSIVLGFQPKAVSYIIYKHSKEQLYTTFTIPKKSGATRIIHAPCPELKNLQSVVSKYLQDCLDEINESKSISRSLSHGFKRGYSIVTNASVHKHRRLVLNLDLEDFFGSINFGRVRGFFITNNNFSLQPSVATVLAQIICFDNSIPQGSPCSPVVSNLIGHLLDIKLAKLASETKCTYSRYADDLTFSTNKQQFPADIILPGPLPHDWVVGARLEKIIRKCGFAVNNKKTRLQYRNSRQDVTGLTVNQKVNVPAEYRRRARAMAHKLFETGNFHVEKLSIADSGKVAAEKRLGSIDELAGIFSHIAMVTQHNNALAIAAKVNNASGELSSIEKTHRDFIFYKSFYANPKPMIICEGKTDNVYLRCAIRSLAKSYPLLAKFDAQDEVELSVSLFKYSKLNSHLLGLSGGSSQLRGFISEFSRGAAKYRSQRSPFPVIVLIDNDKGAKEIFSTIKSTTKTTSKIDGGLPYYHIAQGLYVVPTPKLNGAIESKIEDFFPDATLNQILDGKRFNSENEDLKSDEYGKHYFAEYVVKKQQANIDFSGFKTLLDVISTIIAQNIGLHMSAVANSPTPVA